MSTERADRLVRGAGLLALSWCAVASGCAVRPAGWPPLASDRYEKCDSTTGRLALDAARESIARGDYAAALPELRRAIAECPDEVRTHLLFVETSERADRVAERTGAAVVHQEAARAFYAHADDGKSPVWPYLRARLASQDAEREALFDEALARDPSFYWVHLSWARIMRGLRRPSRALLALDKALAARPGFPEARLERAEVLAELGRFQESASEYANYIRQRPGDRAAQRQYARLLVYDYPDNNSWQQAEPIVASMLEDDPDDVDALMNMAAIDWRAFRAEAARARYRRVLELDPTQARAVLNLGNLYYDALWRSGGMTREESLARAREAYLVYLQMQRTIDRYDVWDIHFTVPLRLDRIGRELGPYAGESPAVSDL